MELNQVVTRTIRLFLLFTLYSPVQKITVTSGCKIKIAYIGPPLALIRVYDLTNVKLATRASARPLATIRDTTTAIVDLPRPGEYYIAMIQNAYTQASPYTLTVTTFCDSFCVNANNPVPPPTCGACGDGILDQGEECDNGNRPGCNGCLVEKGYNC